ncbi:MAG: hypothetical protein PHI48_06405 [Bacteroidales bacterium]|nr:hypothetical protein [Bacteroidales bacterium]
METSPELNAPKKDYCTPMHTCEHILNQTMIRMFGCGRAKNAHIEKKKSKCDYALSDSPTDVQIAEIEQRVNEIIRMQLPVTTEFLSQEEAKGRFNLEKLPDDASETLRIVKVGDYDACPCIGLHVENTSEIGQFKILSYDYNEGILRLRFKLQEM